MNKIEGLQGRMVSRRRFLKMGGAAALSPALLQGCSSNFFNIASDKVSDSAWDQLATKLQVEGGKGTVVLPNDPTYSSLALPRNISFAHIRPQGVSVCTSAHNVQESIKWAVEHGIAPVPRSPSAHSYAGYSTTTGLSLDLSPLSGVEIKNGKAKVGAGARSGDVSNKLADYGYFLPNGRCTTVGIAGLTLAGGFGFNARRYGMTCDSLIETEVATADGEIVVCNENQNADLFWACRGGNGGTFGINTSFTFDIQKGSEDVNVFRLKWKVDVRDAEAINKIWRALQDSAAKAPNEFSLRIGLDMSPGTTLEIEGLGQFYGKPKDLQEILAPLIRLKPEYRFIKELDYASAGRYLGALGAPNAFFTKSAFIEEDFDDQVMEKGRAWLESLPAESRSGSLTMFRWGGAIGDIASSETAFIHRKAQYVVEGSVRWRPGDPLATIDKGRRWLNRGFEQSLASAFNGSAFQNFIDRNQPNWQAAYYGENFGRLVDVKAKYDPHDVFYNAQSIPVKS